MGSTPTTGTMDDVTRRPDTADLEGAAGRRDLPSLIQSLADATAGDEVRAVFLSRRHGPFLVDGIVREGVGGALKVGGVLLTDSARRPDKELRRLSAHPGTEEPTGVPSAIPLHGALVRAVFDHETHGPLALTGVATEGAADDLVVVGGWVIAHNGTWAPRLVSLAVLAPTDGHDFVHPPLRESLSFGASEE